MRLDETAETEGVQMARSRIRVFVSSTYGDLLECRGQVRRALQRLGVEDVAMETFTADDARPVDKCVADVRSCDLYVGVFAWRYGHVPPGHEESITALEYRAAAAARIPRLVFLLSEDAAWPRSHMDKGAAGEQIEALRAELTTEHTCEFFHSADDLRAKNDNADHRPRSAHRGDVRLSRSNSLGRL
jgi:hypothetical protein